MSKFERISRPILDSDGVTKETTIRLANGAKIKIHGGDDRESFKLKFSNIEGVGWWVDKQTLDELIAELLFIREEIAQYSNLEQPCPWRRSPFDTITVDPLVLPQPGAPF